jgi:hypothetical protein
MKFGRVHVAILSLIALILGVWVAIPRPEPREEAAKLAAKPRRPDAATMVGGASRAPIAALAPPRTGEGLSARPGKAPAREVLEVLSDAATSYDPAELPVIEPYLRDADAEIRQAALDSMIILGDAAGAPMLRAAAATATPAEAEKLLKAAAFLELPPRRRK